MAEVFEVEAGGQVYEVEADTPQQAATFARLLAAREQGVAQAEASAVERSEPSADQRGADMFREQLSQAGSFGQTPQPEDMPEGAAAKLGMAGTIASLPFVAPTASALVTAPIATGKALLGGAIGSAAMGEGGQWVGRRLPIVGGETAGKVLETVGGLVGGGVGAYTGPKVPVKELLSRLVGGKGLLSAALGGGESAAAKGAATQAAKTVAPEVARRAELDIAIKEARLAKIAADAERAKELHAARLAKASGTTPKVSKTGPRPVPDPAPPTEGATALKPEPEFIPDEAVSLVAEPLPFTPRPSKGTTTMPTNLGGKAKPGPAPTPQDKLEEALLASLDSKPGTVRGKGTPLLEEALANAEGLQAPRIQVGAERVGRQVGMTKEQVRQVAGPVVGEVRGTASPVFPQTTFDRIYDKMLAMSRTGPERKLYAAAAKDPKAMTQVETIRRVFERAGMVVPIAAIAAAIKRKEQEEGSI